MTESTTAEQRVALADRVHFTGRHDDVDPSPGPEACADTDCMTLRRLVGELEALTKDRDAAPITTEELAETAGIEAMGMAVLVAVENKELKAKLEQAEDAAMWVVKNFQEWQDSGDGFATLLASISELATFLKEKP